MNKHICILGGGFGGLYTALSLSKTPLVKSGKVKVTLVERKEHFLFTPLLYELITRELQRWQIAPSYQKLLCHTPIDLCQQQVTQVDLDSKQVKLANHQSLSYDYLVLALGRTNRYADISGLKDYALTFRTIEDAELLNQRLHLLERSSRQRFSIAVIGGGPNGVELACKISDRLKKRGQIYLIERGNQILSNFSQGLRKASQRALASRGIQFLSDTRIEAIQSDHINLVERQQPLNLPVDLVLWAAGTQTLDLIFNLNCPKNEQGKLDTEATLQLCGYPEVFAMGDLASIVHPRNKLVPATAQAAYQQANCVARNLSNLIENKKLTKFNYLHLGDMLTLGKKNAIVSSFGLNLEGGLADKIRRLVYIQRMPTWNHRWRVLKNVLHQSFLEKLSFFSWQVERLFRDKSTTKYPNS